AQFIGENNAIRGVVRELTPDCCTLETSGGLRIRSLPSEALAVGGGAVLALRPERLRVALDGAGHFENQCVASVEELIYHGDHIRLRARACGHDNVLVNIPNNGNALPVRKGDQITLGWGRDDCR